MNCRKIKRYQEEYFDGTLSAKRKADFDSHLQKCSACEKVVLDRKRFGDMISKSMKKAAIDHEPSPHLLQSIFAAAGDTRRKPVIPLILRPKFAALLILPVVVFVLFMIFFQHRDSEKPMADSQNRGQASYLKLTTTHYQGSSPEEWTVKRTHIQRINGEESSLTLELIKDSE